MALDNRIVKIGIEIDGKMRTYEGLDIVAKGTKFANPNQDECTVTISNLAKDVRDYLGTETSPYNKSRRPKSLVLWAGRDSYGVSEIYRGAITNAVVTQPPDIKLELKCMTGANAALDIIVRNQPENTKLSQIAKQIAEDLDANMDFQAVEKFVKNYNYQGGKYAQLKKLEECGPVNVYLDGNNLVVKDKNVPLINRARILNKNTGMIGIPQFTTYGVAVTMLLDNQTVIGGGLDITSELYPSINGLYAIYQLGFHVTSRDTPFYYMAECVRSPR